MAQSLSSILIHIIFSTKNREPMITTEVMQELHSYMVGIARAQGSQVYEIGGIEDHVHILVSLPRTLSLSTLVKEIKQGSSKWMKTKGNEFINSSWQSGYAGFSIGQSSYEKLRKYIQTQKDHHKTISFQNEYREFLKKYCVDYDENYVWD